MRILVAGCEGFLGSYLVSSLCEKKNVKVFGISKSKFSKQLNDHQFYSIDVTKHKRLFEVIKLVKPNILINTIAYTDVDLCEINQEKAFLTNVEFLNEIKKAIDPEKTKLIHISTDQIFDGNSKFYKETDLTSPINYYGKSKLLAEKICKEIKNSVIIRTNFIGWSQNKKKITFLNWLFSTLATDGHVKMFNDVYFSPIEVSKFSETILNLMASPFSGIINISGKDRVSKYEFGKLIANEFGYDSKSIIPISVSDLKLNARRQKDLSLSNYKFEKLFNTTAPGINDLLRSIKINYHKYGNI